MEMPLAWRHLLVSLALLAASGTSSAWARRGPSLPRDLLAVPMVRQVHHFDCGAAALKGLAAYWGVDTGSLRKLYATTNTRQSYGTLPEDLVRGARALGLRASMREHCTLTDLKQALRRGEPVMVQLQAWIDKDKPHLPWRDRWDDGHYAVVVGMDRHNVYFMDPSAGDRRALEKTVAYAWIPKKEFVARWHEFDGEGAKIRHYRRPALFIRGKTPAALERGVLLRGTKSVQVPARPPIRME